MKNSPDCQDIEKVLKAEEYIRAYLSDHPLLEPELKEMLLLLCQFVSDIKDQVRWLETIIKIARERKE